MVFFFHNHFTSGFVEVKVPHYMLTQNMLFREYAFGNLQELTEKIVYDPAMLVYLNGNVNTLRRPNENFGRELLELFTMGEGNYTEWDIVERRHDYLSKSIFGEIIDPQVNDDMSTAEIRERGMAEIPQLIDLIFRQQFDESRGYDATHPYYGKSVAAVFFATKLYRTFVYEIAEPNIVAALADLLVENNFQLKPVLRTLLQSAHFFDPQLRGAQIKSPLDFTIGLLRMYPFVELYRNNQRTWNSILRSVTSVNTVLGLRLLQPLLLDGAPEYEWGDIAKNAQTVIPRLQAFFQATMKLPQFQLT